MSGCTLGLTSWAFFFTPKYTTINNKNLSMFLGNLSVSYALFSLSVNTRTRDSQKYVRVTRVVSCWKKQRLTPDVCRVQSERRSERARRLYAGNGADAADSVFMCTILQFCFCAFLPSSLSLYLNLRAERGIPSKVGIRFLWMLACSVRGGRYCDATIALNFTQNY